MLLLNVNNGTSVSPGNGRRETSDVPHSEALQDGPELLQMQSLTNSLPQPGVNNATV